MLTLLTRGVGGNGNADIADKGGGGGVIEILTLDDGGGGGGVKKGQN